LELVIVPFGVVQHFGMCGVLSNALSYACHSNQ
jgi:hypothetical protein